MSDKKEPEGNQESGNEDGLDPAAEGTGKKSKKKLFIIIGAVVVLLGSVGAAVFFSGVLKKKAPPADAATQGESKDDPAHDATPEETASASGHGESASGGHGESAAGGHKVTYVDLKDILVNLNSVGSKSNFLKLKVSLELENASGEAAVKEFEPRILDTFQVYLRGLRVEDLKGQQGIQTLRQELLTRLQTTVPEAHIKDCLFREVLVQ